MSRIEEALRRASQVDPNPPVYHTDRDFFRNEDVEGAAAAGVEQYGLEPPPFGSAARMMEPVPPMEAELATASAVPLDRPSSHPDQVLPSLNEKLVLSTKIEQVAVEQYRKLAAILHQVQADKGVKVVMVASAMAGEGKTLTAANLALTLSESFRRKVLLIDADLRRPSAHRIFEIPNERGLNDGLNAANDQKLALVELSAHLSVLPAGRPNADPMSGLISDRMRRIIEEASANFEWVIIDTPPIALLPDANLLAEMVDAVLFVIGAGSTPFHLVQRAVKAMNPKRILGVVLNRVVESHTPYKYYHSYATAGS